MNILNPIVYLGVDPDHQDIKTTRTIITVNYFSLVTSMVAMFCGFCIYYMVTKNRFIYIPASIECLGFITIIYLNYLHHQRIATTTFYLLQNIAVFYFAVALGEAGGAIVMVIFLFGLSFLLFQNPLNRTMAATLATINLTILIFIYNYKLIEPVFTPPAGPSFIKFIIYPVIFLHISLLFVLHEKNYNRIIRILTLTKEELRLRSLELERVSNIKSVILAENSHEMRSPLNAMFLIIQSWKEKLKGHRSAVDHQNVELVNDLHFSAYLLRSIINNVLRLSKIESGQPGQKEELHHETFNLRNWMTEIRAIYQYSAAVKRVRIVLSIAENMPQMIVADKLKLTQAVINILGNAIKFTDENTAVRLTVSPSEYGKFSILISDQGQGIAQEHLPDVFNLYASGDGTGNGIGLYVAQNVIQACGGEIVIESIQGRGSTFVISNIPLIEGNSDESENLEEVDFAGFKILIIDDDALVQKYLPMQLADTGATTFFAFNAEDGLSLALKELPDLIISDYNMPGINGVEALRRFKNHPELKHIPVVVMTAHAREFLEDELNEQADFFNQHVAGYISKPNSIQDLKKMMSKLLIDQETK